MEKPVAFLIRGAGRDATEALRNYALRRLSFAVRRHEHRVRQLTVRLVDQNGPRGGRDSRCSMTAELVEGGQLFVEAQAARPFASVALAAKRLSHVLGRDTDRHTAHRPDVVAASH